MPLLVLAASTPNRVRPLKVAWALGRNQSSPTTPGIVSRTLVPAAVPSLLTRLRPAAETVSINRRVPVLAMLFGAELPVGDMSTANWVPAGVPSLRQSSKPTLPSSARK